MTGVSSDIGYDKFMEMLASTQGRGGGFEMGVRSALCYDFRERVPVGASVQ